MIVDGIAAGASLLLCCRHLADVAVVVIDPHERDIFWYLKACVVCFEHFLVGYENLRHSCRVADAVRDELALMGNDVGQCSDFFFQGVIAVHARIVYGSHAKRVDTVLVFAFADTGAPVAHYHVFVRVPHPILIAMTAEAFPLVFIVAEHLFAVAAAHVDVVFRDERDVCLLIPEGS